MRSVRLSLSIFVVGFLFTATAFAQWTAPWEYFRNTPIPINDFGTATSTITVPDNFQIDELQIMVNIDHSKASDLRITLKDPNGSVYLLSEYNGGFDFLNGFPYEDYRFTIFDSRGQIPSMAIPGTAINDPANNSPLFRGIYAPETPLPSGINGAGSWTLEVYDNLIGNTGTLMNWGLIFNRYGDSYKDVRLGATIDIWNSDRYPFPFIDDFTTMPPYTVHGFRPEANFVMGAYIVQNSKLQSQTALTYDLYNPHGTKDPYGSIELPMDVDVYQIPVPVPIMMKGDYKLEFNTRQRSDLFQTRPDNYKMDYVKVTPGSLAYDNGDASKVIDITAFMGECNGATFTLAADQTLTSVDIWQSDAVELEPAPTPGYGTIRIYDNSFNLLFTFGPYDLPFQGNKWVSYPIPPTMLMAGSYTVAICVENMPMFGSTGFGIDGLGSPFAPGGALQRYWTHGIQWYSLDDGNSWFEEFDAGYGTKMIRPNFIFNNSDIGVIGFEQPTGVLGASFTPVVRFGSFAHNPHLPNLLTVGKVSAIDNATGQTVAYTEKRIFFAPSQYETTVMFDPINGLAAGTYTLRAEVWRSDDENDINNIYERTYTVAAAPVIVSFNSKVSAEKRDEIQARLAEQGLEADMIDRTFGFEFPENGNVIWAGEINEGEATQVREFVKNGNFFAVVTDDTRNGDFRTKVFSQVANSQEHQAMDAMMKRNVVAPARDYSLAEYAGSGSATDFFLNKAGDSDYLNDYIATTMDRISNADDIEDYPQYKREAVFTASADINVQGTRLGDLTLAQIVSALKADVKRDIVVFVDENAFELAQNYPNPFNPTTTINYNVPADANISLSVYDMLGREVATLVNTVQSAGIHTVVWDARNNMGATVANGLYLYRMEATPLNGSAASVLTKKMVLSK